ncbi:hypothetical protein HG536_0B02870 [Torulaspora globosa]|uniref:Uncharacterized protein n=1 Tax=Torulaspora globosa TaxID=48254 RepID=A0A7G3ZD38_9SACH|nr:uncharacterized protein HG536_0B02870 [Torulaspora globosa]QLL31424.1 hypothetical protein HG536_0B02870 [Torulaspora globosa]
MITAQYNDLKLLSVWTSPARSDLAHFIYQTVANNGNSTVYYIDATNRFPLKEFQQITSPNNKEVYDRIRIITCLDLAELAVTVNKVVQVLNMDKIHRQQRQSDKDETSAAENRTEILLVLQGLELMFRNTQLNCSPSESHLALRDLLLRLRAIANNTTSDSLILRTILTFPREELLKFMSRAANDSKRLKSSLINGNTLGEYVAKYYADIVI